MWRAWQIIDPRTVLWALVFFLAGMAFLLHFIVYNTERFTWLDGVFVPDYVNSLHGGDSGKQEAAAAGQ